MKNPHYKVYLSMDEKKEILQAIRDCFPNDVGRYQSTDPLWTDAAELLNEQFKANGSASFWYNRYHSYKHLDQYEELKSFVDEIKNWMSKKRYSAASLSKELKMSESRVQNLLAFRTHWSKFDKEKFRELIGLNSFKISKNFINPTICIKCNHHVLDNKDKHLCSAKMKQTANFVTGEFLSEGARLCESVNTTGKCPDFKPKEKQ